jgi:hypothetical protein
MKVRLIQRHVLVLSSLILFCFAFDTGTCPKDFAWADKAYALDTAHQLAECSNAGRCNRKTVSCALEITTHKRKK